MTPIFTITIDADKDLNLTHWFQKKGNLTPKQQEKLNELLRRIERLCQEAKQQKLIA